MRWFVGTFMVVTLASVAGSVEAGGWNHFWQSYARNRHWPEPFIYADRAAAVAPLAIMVNRGWERQNLVGSHHYQANTTELNEAGELKIRWIVTQAPMGRRTIFVERGRTPEETTARIQAIRSAGDRFAIGDEVVDVQETQLVSHGWSGEYSDMIERKFHTSTPDPRLPEASGSINVGN